MESSTYRMGYATSGFAHHRIDDAIALLAELGYSAISLTLDVVHLDPFSKDLAAEVNRVRRLLERHKLAVVVETGARFLLDPRRKHRPTLMDDGTKRLDFLRTALHVARDLGADCMAFWAGALPSGVDRVEARRRLVAGCAATIEEAERCGIDAAFEPEPGMAIETVAEWRALDKELGSPKRFGLCLDIGHVLATGEGDPATVIRDNASRIFTAAIEDTHRGRHEHLPFGEGHLDVPAVLDALEAVSYNRILSVELSRHAYDAVNVATRARDVLIGLGAPFRVRQE